MPDVDVLTPLQIAMRDAAIADGICGGRIYDQNAVPEPAVFPYTTVGDAVAAHADRAGTDVDTTLHVWSVHHGTSEANGVVGDLVALFNHQPLPVAGLHTVSVRHRTTRPLTDPDDDVVHVAVTFTVALEALPA